MLERINKLTIEHSALVFISFWATVFFVRGVVFFYEVIHESDSRIRIMINGIHYHHYVVGLILLSVLGVFSVAKGWKKSFLRLTLMGISFGLVFDEFYFWFNPSSDDYWKFLNFIAVGLFGTMLWFLVIHSPKATSLKLKLLLVSLLVSLFSLFYIANPAISEAREIRLAKKGISFVISKILSSFWYAY